MSNEKLSTGCALSTASLKKREGKKKPSPLNPYKEKGKGKEQDRRDIFDIPCSQTAGAGAHARVRNPAAYFKAWREAKFGADIDPVRAAVDEAVAAFSTKTPETDRRIWLKIANRVGADEFMRAVWQKQSENGSDKTVLRDTASAFQNLLNIKFPRPGTKGGAGSGTASRALSEFINSESAAGAKDVSAVVGEAAKAGGVR